MYPVSLISFLPFSALLSPCFLYLRPANDYRYGLCYPSLRVGGGEAIEHFKTPEPLVIDVLWRTVGTIVDTESIESVF
jgi:hypothetical protein